VYPATWPFTSPPSEILVDRCFYIKLAVAVYISSCSPRFVNEQIREVVMKYVALNAAKYGKANEKAVIGKVIAENPELKSRAKEVLSIVRECVEEFERMSEDQKAEIIAKYGKERRGEKREIGLPPLINAEKGKVVMRFAPNPNGPATLGSARGIVINGEYTVMYDGKFVIRFDDTDPRTKRPMIEAYDWYLEDIEWLGYKPDEVIYASKRISIYYEYAEKLIEMGKAYTCFCSQQEFKRHRDSGVECPHRNQDPGSSMEIWEKMLSGEYDEGEVVLRIKTEMRHPDPAIRDWVAFRIIFEEHPLTGDQYHVYPTLDFESAIEDHLCGITHIIRGKDLIDSERRQKYIYRYFGWKYPETKHWGRVKIFEFGKLSTSSLKKEIDAGKYDGWDDPKLPTIRAFRRRGFEPEAIKRFFISLGVGENDISISLKNLYAENRKIIDPKANRRFFIWDPVEIKIVGLPEEREVELPLNPVKGSVRKLRGEKKVYITKDDFEKLRGNTVRLKEFCNVILDKKAEFTGYELKEVKKGKNIIHWLPVSQSKPCVVMGDRTWRGYAENGTHEEVGNVVQFERFAFCKVEKVEEGGSVLRCIYTHP
jgi:glutamyl-tRNA synthetase